MKLQRKLNRVVKGKNYYVWYFNIPPSLVYSIGWKEDEKLRAVVYANGLKIVSTSSLTENKQAISDKELLDQYSRISHELVVSYEELRRRGLIPDKYRAKKRSV